MKSRTTVMMFVIFPFALLTALGALAFVTNHVFFFGASVVVAGIGIWGSWSVFQNIRILQKHKTNFLNSFSAQSPETADRSAKSRNPKSC